MHNKTTQILGEIKYATAWPILKQKEEFFFENNWNTRIITVRLQ